MIPVSDPHLKPKFCPNCGEKLLDGARFCGNCGFSIALPDEGPGMPASPPVRADTSQMEWQRPFSQSPGVPPYAPSQRMYQRTGIRPTGVTTIAVIMIVLGALLLLVGLYAGVFLTEATFEDMTQQDPEAYEEVTYDEMKFMGYIMLVVGPILIVPAIFALRGEEWARIVTMIVLGLLAVVFILSLEIITMLIAAAPIFAIYYLNKPEIKEYFRKKQDLYLHPPPGKTY